MREEDKLKELVSKHREDFDYKVPPAAVWELIKTRIPGIEQEKDLKKKPEEDPEKPLILKRRMGAKVWWMAASFLLFAAAASWLWTETERAPHVSKLEEKLTLLEEKMKSMPVESMPTQEVYPSEPGVTPDPIADKAKAEPKAVAAPPVVHESAETELAGIYRLLNDSLSASNRLEAVLRLAELPEWSAKEVAQIHRSLHQDPNTNVRLAALDALARHIPRENAAEQIQELLMLQDDPAIQLELLMAMLMAPDLQLQEATSEHLFALAEDPFTLDFVKEQAYAVLMKVN